MLCEVELSDLRLEQEPPQDREGHEVSAVVDPLTHREPEVAVERRSRSGFARAFGRG